MILVNTCYIKIIAFQLLSILSSLKELLFNCSGQIHWFDIYDYRRNGHVCVCVFVCIDLRRFRSCILK